MPFKKPLRLLEKKRRPILIHAKVPLLNHHTSGVRMEWYRDDLEEARSRDPYPVLRKQLLDNGFTTEEVDQLEANAVTLVKADFEEALQAEDPQPEDLFTYDFAPTPITEEQGERAPEGNDEVVM